MLTAVVFTWRYLGHGDHRPASAAQQDADAHALNDPARIARGHYLATVGDCAACHTAQGGVSYAGGRALSTPFGDVPAPNLTPDDDTGLGQWTFSDFWQALHHGKGRDGELLYPVFSYTSFTKVTRSDALAIFAYLKSLPPVRQKATPLGLKFPYSMRSSLLAWRALYFTPGTFKPNTEKSAAWNRGAYLVEGLGHCNECHAPRNALGATASKGQLTGGQIPQMHWYAPDLSTRRGGGLEGWSTQDIVDLLKRGQSAKGAAFGPMAEVVHNSTQYIDDTDLRAMATYLESLPPRAAPVLAPVAVVGVSHAQGATIYHKQCAQCHGSDGNGVAGTYPPLDGNTSVEEPTGINAIRSVLLGGFPPVTVGNPQPYSMPPFARQLTDDEIAAVVNYIRHSWSNRAAAVSVVEVRNLREAPTD
ncbi:MAG: cytochrome c [Pseudomonadota bacterium]|nr:cytochrome c [Pseudomonadota bacterium]